MKKTLGNIDINGTRKNVPDVVVFGVGDAWQLICKASSDKEGWMKSTKAMEVGHGCLVQVTTQQLNPDASYVVAEALAFAPMCHIEEDCDDDGKVIGRTIVSDEYDKAG